MEIQSSKSLKRLNYLLGEIEAVYHEIARKQGTSDSVSKILYALCDTGEGRCLLHEICRKTGLSKQTVNSALRGLEDQSLIYLQAVDGKAKEVCLTEQGKRFAQKTALQILRIENEIFASWPPEDVQFYVELTERFLDNLTQRAAKLP